MFRHPNISWFLTFWRLSIWQAGISELKSLQKSNASELVHVPNSQLTFEKDVCKFSSNFSVGHGQFDISFWYACQNLNYIPLITQSLSHGQHTSLLIHQHLHLTFLLLKVAALFHTKWPQIPGVLVSEDETFIVLRVKKDSTHIKVASFIPKPSCKILSTTGMSTVQMLLWD